MMHMLSGCEQVSGNGCKSTDLNSVCRREVDGCGSERVLIMVNHHLETHFYASSCDRNESEPLHPALLH